MSDIREFVLNHDLFCHHDHHRSFQEFDAGREHYDFRNLLGYASDDLVTANGTATARSPRAHPAPTDRDRVRLLWPKIRATGYGRAVVLGARELFGLEYTPENFGAITEALQVSIRGKSAPQVYEHFVHQRAHNRWTIQDFKYDIGNPAALQPDTHPTSYRFAFRFDEIMHMVDAGPIEVVERFVDRPIHSLGQMVGALNLAIDRFRDTGLLASIKIGMAYGRDLVVGNPTQAEAERAFNRIRSRNNFVGGIQQNGGAVNAVEGRPLCDYLFHALMQRAADEDLPVQIHTGYLAGHWGSLAGARASHLIPVLERYRNVRFDLFHASWPWASELGALAKNYPNVWADMCWAWAMNPTESARALSEWLDAVPYNKIFAYGADTSLPWCNVGYSLQAKIGIARVLEEKIEAGYMDEATARAVAAAIMLENGLEFYRLSG